MINVEVNGIPIAFCHIEGGRFKMGGDNYRNQQPIHKVEVATFYLGRYPITNEQFLPFLHEKGNQEEKGIKWVNSEGHYEGVKCGVRKTADGFECIKGLEKHPMIYVNWYGARAYCEWLSAQTGQEHRLPSESEWEYAAIGGKHQDEFWFAGSSNMKEVGWNGQNSHGQTKPVGLKFPNEFGLYDMSGNVSEWCADHWHENYKGAPRDGKAWLTEGNSARRVARGGGWNYNDVSCGVSCRYEYNALLSLINVGFRVARY